MSGPAAPAEFFAAAALFPAGCLRFGKNFSFVQNRVIAATAGLCYDELEKL